MKSTILSVLYYGDVIFRKTNNTPEPLDSIYHSAVRLLLAILTALSIAEFMNKLFVRDTHRFTFIYSINHFLAIVHRIFLILS